MSAPPLGFKLQSESQGMEYARVASIILVLINLGRPKKSKQDDQKSKISPDMTIEKDTKGT